jgi:hypothetical protein
MRGLFLVARAVAAADGSELPLVLLGLQVPLDEHAGLAAEDARVARLRDEVDGALGIGARDVGVLERAGGREDDRQLVRARARLDERGGGEAVERGQVDPDERQPDIGARKLRKGLLARGGADDAMAERRENRLEHVEVRHLPVDQQDRGYRPRLFTRLHRRGFSPRDRSVNPAPILMRGTPSGRRTRAGGTGDYSSR